MPMPAASLLATVLILCFPGASHAQWSLELLGTLNGRPTIATAINDKGDVVGYSYTDEGNSIPFIWTAKTGYVTFARAGAASDINNRGAVVGVMEDYQGFLWSEAGGLINLGFDFLPSSINDRGVITGTCDGQTTQSRPCLWEHGALRHLPARGPGGVVGMNDAKTVVGLTFDPQTVTDLPFMWSETRGLQVLPVPSSNWSGRAEDINNAGVIVGWSLARPDEDGSLRFEVMIWDRHGRIQPGPHDTNGIAVGINNRGIVIGYSPAIVFEAARGFTWTLGGDVIFLPGGDASLAADINARGDIAGSVYIDGVWHAAVWRYRQSGN